MKKIVICIASLLALTMPVSAAASVSEDKITAVKCGSSRYDVHKALGAPISASANGMKEQFSVQNGKTAVLIYNKWGYLSCGFIVD